MPAGSDDAFPRRLSETGCYADTRSAILSEGWVGYDVNASLWADGALKRRFLSIPQDTHIGFTEDGAWALPVGALLAKEFWLQGDPADPSSRFIVETRFLVKRCEPGSCRAAWEGYSYRWNADGGDAELLDNDTETIFVEWPVDGGTHAHGYPGRSECTRCHALAAGGSLGLRTPQLNRRRHYAAGVDNQLRALAHAGWFGDTAPADPLAGAPRMPDPSDPAHSTEQRVRAYLDANCSHCHRPGARWPVADFRFDTPLAADNGAQGMAGNICNLLVPGDAAASLLYQKMAARPANLPAGFTGDPMPPLATLLPDAKQLATVATWIETLPSCP